MPRLPHLHRRDAGVVYQNLPADITESDLIKAFFETYPFPCHYYSLTSGCRHIAFEVHSAENVSHILANPLAISNAAISLPARRLPTESELRSQQVFQLRHVPYLKDERTAFEAFEQVIAPYGEIVDLIRDTNTPHPLAHNGNYQLIVKLADLTKAVPHSLDIQVDGCPFTIPVRLDGHANHGGCYFCHSPLHTRRDCTQAPPCRHCKSGDHFWRRCPSRPKLDQLTAPPPSTPPAPRTVSPPTTTVDEPTNHDILAVTTTPTPVPRQARGRSPAKRLANGPLISPPLIAPALPLSPLVNRRSQSSNPNKHLRITRSMARAASQSATSPAIAEEDTEMTEALADAGSSSILAENLPQPIPTISL
ncbi:hypothetical protein V1514DRAFT_339575 [Lipomyces japonicus]|uniref:uncharacterized protein n=1 Tax=Lipomyces japonicus TaxID=56871 RepID=UPI0034CED2BB